jgi:hypothetical protein
MEKTEAEKRSDEMIAKLAEEREARGWELLNEAKIALNERKLYTKGNNSTLGGALLSLRSWVQKMSK